MWNTAFKFIVGSYKDRAVEQKWVVNSCFGELGEVWLLVVAEGGFKLILVWASQSFPFLVRTDVFFHVEISGACLVVLSGRS